MSKLAVTEQALPREPLPFGGACGLLLLGVIAIGGGLLLDQLGWGIVLAVLCTLLSGAAIAAAVRRRGRQDIIDLIIMRLNPLLGWPDPSRRNLVASRWHDGWRGRPKKVVVRYNLLADEAVPQILSEASRQLKKAFLTPYVMKKHAVSKGVAVFLENTDPVALEKDAQLQRARAMVTNAFGAEAKSNVKFADDGNVKEISVGFEVTPRLTVPAVQARIEAYVSAVMQDRWRAFWDMENDQVRFEKRPALVSYIPNPFVAPEIVDPRATYDTFKVCWARDEDGNAIYWKPKDDPHGIATGKTGKGKTVFLLTIIQAMAAAGWEIYGIDGKRIELLGLRSWPNVKIIAGQIDHQARVAHEVFRVMQQRFADYEAGKVKLEDFMPVLFVIDEFKTFKNAVQRWYRTVKPKGGATQVPVLEEISDFVSLARKVRMHLLIGIQRPDAEFLTGDMRDNFGFRVSFGRLSPDGAKMMWDNYSTGVAIPVKAKGRGIARNEHGAIVEIQSLWTPDPYQTDPDNPSVWVFPNDLELVENAQPKKRLHELLRIVDPEEEPDLDGKEEDTGPNYNAYMESKLIPAGETIALERQAAGIYRRVDAEVEEAANARVKELERIQREEEEPDISDEEEMFQGYDPAEDIFVEELLDDNGDYALDGALLLVDEGAGTWGVVEGAEFDAEDDDYVLLTYRDYETGEMGVHNASIQSAVQIRRPGKVLV